MILYWPYLGLFLDEPAAAAVAVGVPVRGQQQADNHQRPHAPHHLHHQGRGVYQHRTRAPLQSRTGRPSPQFSCTTHRLTLFAWIMVFFLDYNRCIHYNDIFLVVSVSIQLMGVQIVLSISFIATRYTGHWCLLSYTIHSVPTCCSSQYILLVFIIFFLVGRDRISYQISGYVYILLDEKYP